MCVLQESGLLPPYLLIILGSFVNVIYSILFCGGGGKATEENYMNDPLRRRRKFIVVVNQRSQ